MFVCLYTDTSISLSLCVSISLSICVYIYIYTHMINVIIIIMHIYIYIYIYTSVCLRMAPGWTRGRARPCLPGPAPREGGMRARPTTTYLLQKNESQNPHPTQSSNIDSIQKTIVVYTIVVY